MEQIRKIASNLNKYFGVIKFITIAITVLTSIAALIILIFDSNSVITTISLEWLSMNLNTPLFTNEVHSKIYLIILLVSSYISILIFFKLLSIIKDILNDFIEENIFKEDLPNHLIDLSKAWFVYGAFTNIFAFIDYRFLLSNSNLISILETNSIHTSTNFIFDVNFIIVSAVIYLLSYVFRYGAQLQQLSDETL